MSTMSNSFIKTALIAIMASVIALTVFSVCAFADQNYNISPEMRLYVSANSDRFGLAVTKDVEIQFKGSDISGTQSAIIAFDKNKIMPVVSVQGQGLLGGEFSLKNILDNESKDYSYKFASTEDNENAFLIFPEKITAGVTTVDEWSENELVPTLSYAEIGNTGFLYVIIKQNKTVDYSDFTTGVTIRFAINSGSSIITSDMLKIADTADINKLNASTSASMNIKNGDASNTYSYYSNKVSELPKPQTVLADFAISGNVLTENPQFPIELTLYDGINTYTQIIPASSGIGKTTIPFTFNAQPTGTYFLKISQANSLIYTVTDILPADSTADLGIAHLLAGDFSGDNFIDAVDVTTISNNMLKSSNDSLSGDINGDRYVDAVDVAVLANNLLKPSPNYSLIYKKNVDDKAGIYTDTLTVITSVAKIPEISDKPVIMAHDGTHISVSKLNGVDIYDSDIELKPGMVLKADKGTDSDFTALSSATAFTSPYPSDITASSNLFSFTNIYGNQDNITINEQTAIVVYDGIDFELKSASSFGTKTISGYSTIYASYGSSDSDCASLIYVKTNKYSISNNVPETEVVVLTATNRYNMNAAAGVFKTDYVAFNIVDLKSGIIDTTFTGYVDKSEFGIEGDADIYIGHTFAVTSFDGFATLESTTLLDAGKTDAVIEGYVNSDTSLISIDGQIYEVVDYFSRLNNTGESIGNYPEIILYNKDGLYTTAGTYQTDAFGNLLDTKGQIALYYMPELVGYVNPYVVKNDDGTYVAAGSDFSVYNLAIVGAQAVGGFSKISNTKTEIADLNAVYDAKIFDVDGDGYYDYGYTVNYKYGAYGVDANGCLTIGSTATGRKADQIKYVDAEGNSISAIGAGYYLYSYNAQAGVLTIKETLSVYSGYLSGLNTVADQLTLGGTVYSYGVAKLPGAEAANVENDITAALIGKNINYVMYDGVIVDILPVQVGGYFVLDSVIGVTSSGLPTVLGYNQNNVATVVTVASLSLNNGSIYHFQSNTQTSIPAVMQSIEKGSLFTAQIDTLGYYHLTEADAALQVATAGGIVDFKNGISNIGSVLGTFSTNDNTVILVYNPYTGKFESRKGQPATGATLTVPQAAEFVVVGTAPAFFIYIKGAVSFEGYSIGDPFVPPANTTIVYVDPASAKATIVDNSLSSVIGANGMLLQGYTYKYSAVADLVNGKAIDVYSVSYNAQVKAGYVYSVVNGYIDEEIGTLEDVLTAVTLTNVTATAGTVNGMAVDRDLFMIMTVDANGNVVRVENGKGIANRVAFGWYTGTAYQVSASLLSEYGLTVGHVYIV